MAGNGIGIGIGFRQGTLLNQFTDYVARVLADSGLIKDRSATSSYMKMAKSNGILDSIRFAWLGEAGYKQRTSGINTFWTKLYSLRGTNDATQTTSTSQPYITGNIAPTERIGMKNPNGGSKYMTHPTISFAANEAWSVTTVVNWNGIDGTNSEICGRINESEIQFNGGGGLRVVSVDGVTIFNTTNLLLNFQNKNIIVSVVQDNKNINIYINGTQVQSFTSNGIAFNFNSLLSGRNNTRLSGSIHAHIIRAQALTPSQVLAEANFLRSLYPEIPSVQIGTQTWATSNCEMVATPQGNLMQNVTLNSNTEKITNGGFDANTNWTLTNATIGSGVLSLLPSATVVQAITATSGKWYKITYTINSISPGSSSIRAYVGTNAGTARTTTGTFTEYVLYTSGAQAFYIFTGSGFVSGGIDNVSVQEVGWSDATNLYNYVYANTAGTDEQKTYAAVKAAGFWCYYNNDAAIGAIYNKLYNWYAVKLLQMDIDYYNAANPSTPWGWRVPTDTDFNTLATTLGGASVAGGKIKKEGEVYWNSPNVGADNSSGFSAIGGGYKDAVLGVPFGLSNYGIFWGIDVKIIELRDNSLQLYINTVLNSFGCSIRLIKS